MGEIKTDSERELKLEIGNLKLTDLKKVLVGFNLGLLETSDGCIFLCRR